MTAMFRDLFAEEIECRVAQASQKGVSLLLYKDARCDQNILDETVGQMNWMRSHCRENANCIVSIWDDGKQQWISKEDTGTESNTEKEKGLASDSFKRACFNWGIGRELYTAPFIWVKAENCEQLEKDDKSGRWKCSDKFDVDTITIKNKKIIGLTIRNSKTRKVVFSMGEAPAAAEPEEPEEPKFKRVEPIPAPRCERCGNTITARKNRGVVYTPEQIAEKAKATYHSVLCWDCMTAINVAQAEGDANEVAD